MQTRASFYRSDAWRRFLDNLKEERIDDDGNIICAYCGKPIVRAYDIIGHHKIELTEENVNDANIALNPDNVEFVHHRCHNRIHDRLGINYQRQVFLVYGAPLSGKTSWVKDNHTSGDLIIDLDSIWEAISGGERYTKPPRLKAVVFQIRDTLLDAVKHRQGNWLNAYIIGGYPIAPQRERLAAELGAREIYIESTKDECIERLEKDPQRDKKAWRGYIDEWFAHYTPPSI